MYQIHGYVRGEIVPTLELGMAHLEPSERERARQLWDQLLIDEGPLAGYHTVIDARGRRHQVLTVADRVVHHGKMTGIKGYLTDITASVHEDSHRRANQAVVRSAEHRSIIEQAKGILMVLQVVSADQAFLVLSRYSQHTHQKVHDIARLLVDATTTTDRASIADIARVISVDHTR